MTKKDKLARAFSELLVLWVGEANLQEIIKANRGELSPLGCCASHDHIDANEVMLDAFELMGLPLLGIGESNALTDLWNDSWTIAKANDFYNLKVEDVRKKTYKFFKTKEDAA